MRNMRIPLSIRLALAALFAFLLFAPSCRSGRPRKRQAPPPRTPDNTLRVTGYCNCGQCCGWTRRWFGLGASVYAYGKLKGKPKQVGITASGTRARPGTLAADINLYPFGTRLYIPGYGTGVVEDVGGAIKGRHIDAWFPTHEAAKHWGSRRLPVTVLPPLTTKAK
jgi:3D (Asp-Asp-Asp) domain-containing protein